MAKVITLSRRFLKGHPKEGQPTYFVEKTLNSLLMDMRPVYTSDTPVDFLQSLSKDLFHPKHHTIRNGKRWKTGDMASLRVWSDKPYNSPQIIIAPDIPMVVKDIEVKNFHCYIDGRFVCKLMPDNKLCYEITINDGLSYADFRNWFKLPCFFSGQMLIWNNKNLSY